MAHFHYLILIIVVDERLVLVIILEEIIGREQHQWILLPFSFHCLVENTTELRTQTISYRTMLIGIRRT